MQLKNSQPSKHAAFQHQRSESPIHLEHTLPTARRMESTALLKRRKRSSCLYPSAHKVAQVVHPSSSAPPSVPRDRSGRGGRRFAAIWGGARISSHESGTKRRHPTNFRASKSAVSNEQPRLESHSQKGEAGERAAFASTSATSRVVALPQLGSLLERRTQRAR